LKHLTYLLLLLNSIAFSQQYNFKHYGLEEGLAQSQVYAIDQDDKGFLWIGTQGGGVNIFDGTTFKNIKRKEGLTNLYINKIKFQEKKGIWIGSDNGLFLFSREKILKQVFLKGYELTDIFISKNSCYIGTDKGAFMISSDNQITQLSSADVQCLFHKKDNLYIATNKQVTCYSNDTISYSLPLPLSRSFYEMNNHLFVCTYSQGIFKIDSLGLTHQAQIPNSYGITTSFSTNVTTSWIATISNGVFCIKNDTVIQHFNTQKGLPSNSIRAIFEDNRRTTWIGTSGHGLCQFINDDIYSIDTKNIGTHAIFNSNDNLLLGTFSGGLDTFPLKNVLTNTVNETLSFTHKKIRSFSQIDKHSLWVGTDGDGIFSYQNNQFTSLFTDNEKLKWVRTITPDNQENIWIGSLGFGLFYYKDSTLNQLKDQPFERVNDLLNYSKNQLAIASNKGFFLLNTKSKTLQKTQYKDACRSLTSCNNLLFVGTKNDGVFYLKNDSLHKLKKTWSDNIYFVRTDNKNNLWVGSERGVQKFSFYDFPQAEVVNIGKERGLIGIETCVNSFALDSVRDGVWIGTIEGVSFIKSNISNTTKDILPLLTITEMDVFYDPIPNFRELSATGLRFFYHQNHISFRVLGIDLEHAGEMKYKWKLNGYDKKWSSANRNNYITYSNLPFGEYHFLVKASLDGKTWTKEEVIDFSILRPFWRTYSFYTAATILVLLMISVAIFIAYKGYRWKIAQHQKNLRIQNRVKELELNTLRLQLNPHFLFNCLNSIKGYIAENQGKEARKQITNFAKLMRQYLDNSSTQWITISEETKMLTNYLNLEVMLNNDNISFELSTQEEDFSIPPMIIQPFVENAIHHGLKPLGKPGLINIRFYLDNNDLICEVIDNGIGRDKAAELSKKKEHDSKALSIIKERLHYLSEENGHNYHYQFTDLTQGTMVKVWLPYLEKTS
jgi:ligand-binding sensor domain-containing protein